MARPPLYLTVSEVLRQRIEAGAWKTGDRLPNEQDLAKELFVSRVTLREALGLLERDGIISRRHGLGSFVERKPISISGELSKLEPFAMGVSRAGFEPIEEIVSLDEAQIPQDLALAMSAPPNTQGYRLEMLRHMEKIAIIHSRDFILPGVIDPQEFRAMGRNILDYLSETGRPRVDYSFMTLKAVLPDAYEQGLLRCDPLEPMIRLDGIAYTNDHRALYTTSFLIRSKHYELTLLRHS
jgi:GntR family transcriptional regulator